MTARSAGYAIALDVGGTFTDVALVHETSGRLWVTKTPTTPDDPSAGFIAGIDKALRLAGVEAAALRHVLHGTTTATNAILEGKGAPTGLLTTAGFRDVLEIGRHDIPRRANMFAWVKPLAAGAARAASSRSVAASPSTARSSSRSTRSVRAAARRLREAGVDSVAVCFLHSYANAAHERRARDAAAARSTPAAPCRCRARCCRCSASSSARWPPCSTPTCSRWSGATSGAWRSGSRGGASPRRCRS